MSILKKWGLVSSDEDDEPKVKTTPKKIVKIGDGVFPPNNNTQATFPTMQIVDNEQYDKLLEAALNKRDLPGPDFLEFYKTLKTFANQPIQEQQKYELAFGALNVMGLTKDKILSTANTYIEALNKEKDDFDISLKQYDDKEIVAKQNEYTRLSEENIKLQKQIQDNMTAISNLSVEITKNKQNYQSKEQAFHATIAKEQSNIAQIINNVKTYINESITK